VTAADIGTGARTALAQIAADELGVSLEQVDLRIGDSDFGPAMVAGGSMGTASWGWAVVKACRQLRVGIDEHGGVPEGGLVAHADTSDDIAARADLARHAFGAQFAEVRVDVDTGEIRVPRMVGVFAVGRIVNAKTARSQLIGGMTMGLSMALLEESMMDVEFGDYVNHDFASYHVAVNADVQDIDVSWIDEEDDQLNPMGVKGIGEIGIVGTAAAIANAVHHATGHRQRDLPIRPDRILAVL
jgi:xanthine dehydrogenase YagR molybdenum-binding subunit